jgi:signal recognition particle GTPase
MFKRLREGIARTRDSLLNRLGRLLGRREPIDASSLEALENALLEADVGVSVTSQIMATVRHQAGRESQPLIDLLRAEMVRSLTAVQQPLQIPPNLGVPFVILVVGVNGVGKTTTIAKLGRHLQAEGHKVMFAAGDTLASHAGWTENTAYTTTNGAGTRATATFGTATTADPSVINNTASPGVFTMTSNAQTIAGAFLASVSSGTSGILFSAGDFTGGDKTVDSGDSLSVTYQFSLDAA